MTDKKRTPARRAAFLGAMTALALILSYVESFVPMPLPGVKLGLANLVAVFVLYREGVLRAAGVSLIRVLLSSLLFGSTVSLAYSLAGAALSIAVMACLRRTDRFSPLGVSIAGGVMHNAGQIIVCCILLDTAAVAAYLPILTVSGAVAGVAIGALAALLLSRIPKK
ncbi:MAG: Gx transporter family protein [Clostridia bacterium]|nr:Gx transporter family protein [Clostridia bacterium]